MKSGSRIFIVMGEQYVEIVELACVEIVALGQYVNSDGRPSPVAPDGTGHTGQAGPSLVSSLTITIIITNNNIVMN